MSKAAVKKYIHSLDREALEQLVLDMYSARKEAKELLEYMVNPNDQAKYEEYKAIITKEFYPKRGEGKMRYSVCKKAVKEFKSLDPDPMLLADLMLLIPEYASQIADDWGDLWEAFYDGCYNNFRAALKYISDHELYPHFKKRIAKILQNSESSGWGFPDIMNQAFEEYFPEEVK